MLENDVSPSIQVERKLMIVSRIALTRPEMASRVEDLLVRMGQAGQIRGQVTDDQLKGLLQQVSRAEGA
jgi:DNA-binding TFAR19-related protein (PDSD5 family)